jgi:hypothetical protein
MRLATPNAAAASAAAAVQKIRSFPHLTLDKHHIYTAASMMHS